MKSMNEMVGMKKIRVLHMYNDVLDLYGDIGNIITIRYRTEKRGYECEVTNMSIGDDVGEISEYDIVFIGGGADYEQSLISEDLISRKESIRRAAERGTQFLLICGAYQLFGEYYLDASGNKIEGLGLLPYHTIASSDAAKRCIGNILLETTIDGETFELVGFENHSGQTHGGDKPLGKVIRGHGNAYESETEGYMDRGFFCTYLHGPILPKNPKLADILIKRALGVKELEPLDDAFEKEAFETMRARLLK